MDNILMDWKFWVFTVSVLKDIVLVLGIILVKFNDMKHLTESVKGVEKSLSKIFTRLGKVEKAIVKRDAICEERHK